jgi:hypothetical protein
MNWFNELSISSDECHVENDTNYSIRDIEQTFPQASQDFFGDIVLQWILCPFVIKKGVVYQISTVDSELKEYVFASLRGLFNRVRGVYVNEQLTEIRLEEINNHAKNSFTNVLDLNKINLLVRDFYMKESTEPRSNQIDVKLFEIVIDKFIEQTEYRAESNHVTLWDFLKKSNLSNEQITLFPTNWMFNDSLLQSPFLIFISRYADEVVLTVNDSDQNVRAITFK